MVHDQIHEEEIWKVLKKTEAGKECWGRIIKDIEFDINVCFVCLPTSDEKLNRESIGQLGEYLQAKYYRDFCIVSCKGNKALLDEFSYTREKTIYIDRNSMENLVSFIKIQNLGDNVVVISLEEPFCNYSMAKKIGIPMEEYIAGTFLWRSNATFKE